MTRSDVGSRSGQADGAVAFDKRHVGKLRVGLRGKIGKSAGIQAEGRSPSGWICTPRRPAGSILKNGESCAIPGGCKSFRCQGVNDVNIGQVAADDPEAGPAHMTGPVCEGRKRRQGVRRPVCQGWRGRRGVRLRPFRRVGPQRSAQHRAWPSAARTSADRAEMVRGAAAGPGMRPFDPSARRASRLRADARRR